MAVVPAPMFDPTRTEHYAYVDYGVAGEPWHERCLVRRVWGATWIICTPDMDVYAEDLSVEAYAGVRVGDSQRRLPAGLGVAHGAPVYRFTRPLSAAALRDLYGKSDGAVEEAMAEMFADARFPSPSTP